MSTGGTTGAAVTAVILDDMKDHLRIDNTDSDDIILEYIDAAVQYIEDRTGRRIINTSDVDYFDSWGSYLELSRYPVASLDSITYYDNDNAQQTLSSSLYVIDLDSRPTKVFVEYNAALPGILSKLNSIAVNYTAGGGTTWAGAPETIKQALYLLVGDWYNNRENSGEKKLSDISYGVEALLGINKTNWGF